MQKSRRVQLRTNTRKAGHEVTFVHLTAGEKGNPADISVEDYREQKIRESEKVAEILGVKYDHTRL